MSKHMAPFFEAHAPKSEADIVAFLKRNGIPDMKPGRPRKGERRSSEIMHVRVNEQIRARVLARARREHIEPAEAVRRALTQYAMA